MPKKRPATDSGLASGDDNGKSESKYFKMTTSKEGDRLPADFYQRPCVDLAKALLGKKLVRRSDSGELLAGVIVETEAYLGRDDKAAHSYGGKKTNKNEAMFMKPGSVCVYNIYGVMTCIKISSQGEGAAVLIRAVDATHGQNTMRKLRGVKRPDNGEGLKDEELGSGPSKLTQAMIIDKAPFNKGDISKLEKLWIESGTDVNDKDVIASKRIGVVNAGEWAEKPLRFYVRGNKSISVRDKAAEQLISGSVVMPEKKSARADTESKAHAKSSKETNSQTIKSNLAPKEGRRMPEDFYQQSCEDLAKSLLGKKLVRKLDNGELLAGDIVETEAYLGGDDKAAHSFGGKKTTKNEAMYMNPGTVYVYNIYGVMTCINISSEGEGAAVLIRAVDVTHGQNTMKKHRGVKRTDKGEGLKDEELGSGPSKLTQALSIDKASFNKGDICQLQTLWIQPGADVEDKDIVVSQRVGVDYAGEWAKKPLRFYVRGNKSISVRDKLAEQLTTGDAGDAVVPKKRPAPKSDDVSAADTGKDKTSEIKKIRKSGETSKDTESKAKKSNKDANSKSRMPEDFYQQSCKDLAKSLLGKKLVRKLDNGELLAGDIVETEAYLGGDDKAAHSFGGKKTTKNEAMYMKPGTVYVYNIYGVMTCINISSEGEGAAVLIRAVDVTHGQNTMKKHRGLKRTDKGEGLKDEELGSGPSKLTQALSIDKASFNKGDICQLQTLWIQPGADVEDKDIVVSQRVGVDYAGEWAKKPLRFYIRGNKSISVRDKLAEQLI